MKQLGLFCAACNIIFSIGLAFKMSLSGNVEAVLIAMFAAFGWLATFLHQLKD